MEMEPLLSLEEQTEENVAEKPRKFKKCMPVTIIILMTIGIVVVTTLIVLCVKEHNDNKTQRKSMENEHTRRINSLLSTVDKLRTEVNTRNAIRDALSMKIKSVEQKLISIQNSTTRELKQLRGKLDNTIESLRETQKTINTLEDELNSTKQDIVHIFNTESNRSHVKEHNDNNIQRKSMENEHRRKMDSLFPTMGNVRTEPKTISTFREKTGPLPNSSLQSIQDDFTSLNSTVDKMRRYLARQSNSSDVRMHHLLSVLKQATKDLRLVKSELTQLNISLRSDLNWKKNSLFPSMENLRTELKTMNNSITSAMNKFQDELNSTKRDIVHIFNTLFHHNSSFHSKIQDASDALLMEVKYVEQKLVSIQNSTTQEVQQLRRESTNTVKSLRDAHNKIVQSNRSLYTALERTATSLRSSIRNVNRNIVNLRKDIESNKRDMATQYKNINKELSKKVKFQEFQRKLKIATSGLETKMENNQASQKKVQRSQQVEISKLQDEVETLRKDINHLKNKASSSLHVKECLNMPFVIVFSFVIKYILN